MTALADQKIDPGPKFFRAGWAPRRAGNRIPSSPKLSELISQQVSLKGVMQKTGLRRELGENVNYQARLALFSNHSVSRMKPLFQLGDFTFHISPVTESIFFSEGLFPPKETLLLLFFPPESGVERPDCIVQNPFSVLVFNDKNSSE